MRSGGRKAGRFNIADVQIERKGKCLFARKKCPVAMLSGLARLVVNLPAPTPKICGTRTGLMLSRCDPKVLLCRTRAAKAWHPEPISRIAISPATLAALAGATPTDVSLPNSTVIAFAVLLPGAHPIPAQHS